MALDFSPISFPWEMVGQAQQMRNQNQQNFQQNLAGIGTGMGNIANAAAKYKALNVIRQALANQRGQTGAPLAPGTEGPQMPTPDFSNQPGVLPAMMVLNPEAGSKALMSRFDPSIQSEIALRQSEAAKIGMQMSGGLPAEQAALAEAIRAHKESEELKQTIAQGQKDSRDQATELMNENRKMALQQARDQFIANLHTKHPIASWMPWSATSHELNRLESQSTPSWTPEDEKRLNLLKRARGK